MDDLKKLGVLCWSCWHTSHLWHFFYRMTPAFFVINHPQSHQSHGLYKQSFPTFFLNASATSPFVQAWHMGIPKNCLRDVWYRSFVSESFAVSTAARRNALFENTDTYKHHRVVWKGWYITNYGKWYSLLIHWSWVRIALALHYCTLPHIALDQII